MSHGFGAGQFLLEYQPPPSQEPQKTDSPCHKISLLRAALTSEAMKELLPRSLVCMQGAWVS